ncbi:MAG: hypothetical protein U5L10_03460 [Candidatus Moranbacteria bacterium]|nr:hypothetical protein [Candidatus Moranbacteria bacterium]
MKLNWKNSLIILLLILVLGGFLRMHKLENQSFTADEYLGINAVYGKVQTGEWKFWDWNNWQPRDEKYTRGLVYYGQSAFLLNYLDPTEVNFRILSVIWGMMAIVLMFFATYYFTKNFIISLLSAFLWSISISAITFDRHFRMYAMFAPVYLALSLFVYRFLESRPGLKLNKINFLNKLSKRTELNWYCFFLAVFLLWLSFSTHLLTVNLFPVITLYLIILAYAQYRKNKNWKNKYAYLLAIPVVSLAGLLATGIYKRAASFFDFPVNHFKHLENITLDYSHTILAMTLLVLGAIYLISRNFKKGLWLTLSFAVPFLLAIFVWDRNPGDQYIYFIQTFEVILIASGIYFASSWLAEKFRGKHWYDFLFKKNKHGLVFWAIVLYLIFAVYNFGYWDQDNSFYKKIAYWDNSNYREVFAYYKKHRSPDALLVTRDFRNYYYAKLETPVFDFGGENQEEDKLTLEKIKNLEQKNKEVWIVISTNDHAYIKSPARHYIRDNYEPLESRYANDSMEIWRWKK